MAGPPLSICLALQRRQAIVTAIITAFVMVPAQPQEIKDRGAERLDEHCSAEPQKVPVLLRSGGAIFTAW